MNRHCTIRLFMSLLVCWGVASAARGQSEAESKAPYQMPSPKGWGRERIKSWLISMGTSARGFLNKS